MSDTDPLVCLGLDWADPAAPGLRVAAIGGTGPAATMPLTTALTYRAEPRRGRFCCGWFDLAEDDPQHVVCRNWAQLDKGRQCDACRLEEGFLTAHQSHRGAGMPAKVRAWMQQTHWLYLDIFADATIKVGTVADARRSVRLAEQGPVAAFYVARADDGIDIRKVESHLSTARNLPQAVRSGRKLRSLGAKVDQVHLRAELETFASDVRPDLDGLVHRYGWATPIEPQPWEPSPIARAVFDSAPVHAYPASLTDGAHHLNITGVAGPIATFTAGNGPDAPAYAADLTQLVGTAIALDAHAARDAPALQSSLF